MIKYAPQTLQSRTRAYFLQFVYLPPSCIWFQEKKIRSEIAVFVFVMVLLLELV
jgi:hypothetical protein